MQITETKSEGLSRELKVALPASEIEEKIGYRLEKLAATAQLPGFRPGKVPVSLLRKRYGPSVMGEVLERAVNDSSQQALAEKGIRPAMRPEIEITSFKEGGDLEYTIAVELLPDITPVNFSTIKLERYVIEADSVEIDKTLADIAQAHGTKAPAKEGRAIEKGDVVVIDFVGRVDGKEFVGGMAEDYELEVGSGSFIPGFEEQLIGAAAGDKVEVKVTFPEAYGAAELSGKDAVFDVTVKELRESVPSAIDDELAKKLGMENLDALKKSIKEEHEREFNGFARLKLKRSLLDALSDAHDFEVPEKLTEREFESIWKQYEDQRKEAGEADKADKADKDTDDGKSDEENKREFREIAERRIRLGLLLSEIGRNNHIQVSQEDINRQIMAEARQHPERQQEVLDHFKNSPEAIEQLTAPIYEDKVIDFILEMAEVTDKKVTSAGLMKAIEEESEVTKPKAKSKASRKPAKKTAKTKSADK